MGPNSMASSPLYSPGERLLARKMHGRGETAGPPRRVEPGGEPGRERQPDGQEDHRDVQPEEVLARRDRFQPLVQEQERAKRKQEPDRPSDDADQLALDDVLQEDVRPGSAERAAHADLARAREELPE